MVRLRRSEVRQVPIEWAGLSVILVSRVWVAWVATRWFAFGGSYHQPLRVEVSGADAYRIPIRDHVALATAGVLAAISLVRRIRR